MMIPSLSDVAKIESYFKVFKHFCNIYHDPKCYKTIQLFSCSAQLSMIFIMLINVKMPTTVGILTFISRINNSSESLKTNKKSLYFFIILIFISR